MDMQDKEFDALFRDKLDSMKIEPSANVWKGISAGLDGKRKHRFVPFLSIAASIIVLITAGIFFTPRVTTPVKKTTQLLAETKEEPKQTATLTDSSKKPARVAKKMVIALAAISNKAAVITHTKSVKTAPSGFIPTSPVSATEVSHHDEQPVLASVSQKQPDVMALLQVNESANVDKKQPAEEKTISSAKPLSAATAVPVAALPAKVKHKGHTLGDFINVVIAQVDKRKDKFIEFSDTDDDQSSITGVNIGIIKIKKDK